MRRQSFKDVMVEHIRDQFGLYLLVLFVFTAGIVFGSFSLSLLAESELTDINNYFASFLESFIAGEQVYHLQVLQRSLLQNGIFMLILWLCGSFFLGFIPALGIIFYRGFTIGFTVGFLAEQNAMSGVLFAMSSVLPQNLLYVPLTLVCGTLSVSLSLALLRRRIVKKNMPVSTFLAHFSMAMIIALMMFAVGSLVETFVTPVFMRAVVSLL